MFKFFSFLTLLTMYTSIVPQYCLYMDSLGPNYDFFYQLDCVIGALDEYEQGLYCGVKLDFEKGGKYYSRYKGSNWWEYFFEPLMIGDTHAEYKRIPAWKKMCFACSLYELDVKHVHNLITKYIKIKPEILKKVKVYQEKQLNDAYVIGICYTARNVSSLHYSPPVSYKAFFDILQVHILEKRNVKIFVYTNDQRFYAFLKVKLPDNVVHYKRNDHFELEADRGEHELINCLLLSQVDMVLSIPSRFSQTISQFNPQLPIIELGECWAKKI